MDCIVHYKFLSDKGVAPYKATPGAVGHDLFAAEAVMIRPGEVKPVGLGFAVQLPAGVEMQIRPRSGLSMQRPNYVANGVGTIDPDYRGEVKVLVVNNTKSTWYVCIGDRIAQAVFNRVADPFPKITLQLSDTERGDNGFGSTG